jgi:hypothetical protein
VTDEEVLALLEAERRKNAALAERLRVAEEQRSTAVEVMGVYAGITARVKAIRDKIEFGSYFGELATNIVIWLDEALAKPHSKLNAIPCGCGTGTLGDGHYHELQAGDVVIEPR